MGGRELRNGPNTRPGPVKGDNLTLVKLSFCGQGGLANRSFERQLTINRGGCIHTLYPGMNGKWPNLSLATVLPRR